MKGRALLTQPQQWHTQKTDHGSIAASAGSRSPSAVHFEKGSTRRWRFDRPIDRFLCPLTLNKGSDAKISPNVSKSGYRCSNKGFLAMSVLDYVSLLDWTARPFARAKQGWTPKDIPPVFQRLGFEPTAWCKLVQEFGQMFRTVAGHPKTVDATRSRVDQHRFNLGGDARKLLTTVD